MNTTATTLSNAHQVHTTLAPWSTKGYFSSDFLKNIARLAEAQKLQVIVPEMDGDMWDGTLLIRLLNVDQTTLVNAILAHSRADEMSIEEPGVLRLWWD